MNFRNSIPEDVQIGAGREMAQAALDDDRTTASALSSFDLFYDGIYELWT
jgi:hypothetical protein